VEIQYLLGVFRNKKSELCLAGTNSFNRTSTRFIKILQLLAHAQQPAVTI
jgi:hypothetical protein